MSATRMGWLGCSVLMLVAVLLLACSDEGSGDPAAPAAGSGGQGAAGGAAAGSGGAITGTGGTGGTSPLGGAAGLPVVSGSDVTIAFDAAVPQLAWAVERLDAALVDLSATPVHADRGSPGADISVDVQGDQAPAAVLAEGFTFQRDGDTLSIISRDSAGGLYGLLEAAEQLRMTGDLAALTDRTVNPRFPFRAIKFNLPWSSYRIGEALQLHTDTCRDVVFWEGFLDMMAENRFNALTLWNMHPWPYLIRPTNFPLATPFSDAELDEWQSLWTSLFAMAKERGIKTYLVTWNIFVSEAFRDNYDPNAGTDMDFWADGTTSAQAQQYSRECVTQVINEYPDLSGLGAAAGDGMNSMTAQESQDWIADVYYGGIADADRDVEFIHRAAFRGAGGDLITRATVENTGLNAPIWVELKFNWSHGLSTPTLVQIHSDGGNQGAVNYVDPMPQNYKITWMIRNEDIFVLRWGQADFIRDHIAQNGQDYVGGYYLGSETYIPAQDYIHQPGHAHVSWTYEFERKWLMFMQWGRLLYDPNTPDAVFEAEADRRYGAGVGAALSQAMNLACIASLRFASFAQSTWDYTLYTEGFMKTDFVTLDELIAEDPFDPAYLGIREYVNAGQPATSPQVTPMQLADELEQNALQALGLVEDLTGSPTLACEIADVQMWVHFGLYFANKIRAGIAQETGDIASRDTLMTEAVSHWQAMVDLNATHNHEQIPDMQNGTFSWRDLLAQVQAEAP